MNPATCSEPLRDPSGRTSIRLQVQGVEIEVDAPEPLLERLRDRLGLVAVAGDRATAPTVGYRLVTSDETGTRFERHDGLRISGDDEIAALDSLTDHLHGVVANRSMTGLFVHAGVFAFAGRLVIVPGRSRTGKSSLVACAVAHGAAYFSDEYAIIDESAMVRPYPRPISLRTPDGPALRHVERDRGGSIGSAAATACLVLVTNYEPGATWHPEQLVGARAALPIIANTVHARRLAGPTVRLAARIAHEALVLEGPRGDAEAMIPELERVIRALPDPTERSAEVNHT